MKKLLLHIGTGKTGSTSIQHALYYDPILSHHFAYPKLGPLGHNFLSVLFRDFDDLTRGYQYKYQNNKKRYVEDKEKLLNEVKRLVEIDKPLVISAESFFRLKPGEIKILKQYFQEIGMQDVMVLVYIRRPSDFYLSIVQQKIKASFDFNSPYEFRYPFIDTIYRWKEYFPGHLRVRLFDKETLFNGCVVQDFLREACGFFQIEGLNISNISLPTKNTSLSAEAMIALQRYRKQYCTTSNNKLTTASKLVLEKLSSIPSDIKQTKPVLKQELAAIIDYNHSEDLKKIQAWYDISFKTLNSSKMESSSQEDHQSVESLFDSYKEESVNEILLYLLHESIWCRQLERVLK